MPPARVDRFFRGAQLVSSALLLALARRQRRAEDDGHHRRAARVGEGVFARADRLAAPSLPRRRNTIPLWVEIGAYTRDLARHAVRRLAHRAHDGPAHHEAAAGRRILRRDGRARSHSARDALGIPVSTTHTITGSIVGVGATSGSRRCAGESPGRSCGRGSSRFRRRRHGRAVLVRPARGPPAVAQGRRNREPV